jgi:hypothetical protein
LILGFADRKARQSLVSVLAPDNRELPRGLVLKTGGGSDTIEISMESESASTSLSTALAFLRDVALFQEVWLLSHRKGGTVHRADRS